jgi:Cu-Zn family superoxide dismutase
LGKIIPSCEATGTHFNPKNQTHGDPLSSIRHVGDRGNFMSDNRGCVDKKVYDPLISLYGEDSIMNRSLVIHSNRDDLNYKTPTVTPTGNSGPKIGCGVVAEYRYLDLSD